VATARLARVVVHRAPAGQVTSTLANPSDSGAPLTFLVEEQREGWLKVLLPVRPNGSTGWVQADQVSVATTAYRLVAHLKRHRLEVWKEGRMEATYLVGVGTSLTPTPMGRYYLTELLALPDPRGPYGPYAFGLSAYSDVLTRFAGGTGQIGLHGTDHPEALGTDVSHGCLRVANPVIARLAAQLPLGTPIDLTA
jgi:lipoprotein-anchoring transpeptidase ErfK/SrfK